MCVWDSRDGLVDTFGIRTRETLGYGEMLGIKTDQKGDEVRKCSTMKVGPTKKRKENHKLKQWGVGVVKIVGKTRRKCKEVET